MTEILQDSTLSATRKRKRVRRLVDAPEEGRKRFRRTLSNTRKPKKNKTHCSCLLIGTCVLLTIATTILVGNLLINPEGHAKFIRNFVKNYREHYHQIVHGKRNYCADRLDSLAIHAKIRQDQIILHQNKALLELQWAMELSLGNNGVSFIALVGPVGVGKALYTIALQKYFPWPENVYYYVWNKFGLKNKEKLQEISMHFENFSDCGVNLLIIKNLAPSDKQLIDTIAEMFENQLKRRKVRSIVIFVFNLNTMLDETEYAAQYNSLQNMNHTKTINFRSFGKEELEDCIRRESKLENVTLSRDMLEELLETIDVKHSGCKNVNAKVLALGKMKEKLEP